MNSYPKEYERNAEILKALSHPIRLCITKALINTNGCTVSTMHSTIKCSQSTLSQHIGKLKACNIIAGQRYGKKIIYKVINKEAIQIINILFNNGGK